MMQEGDAGNSYPTRTPATLRDLGPLGPWSTARWTRVARGGDQFSDLDAPFPQGRFLLDTL